MLTFRYFFNVHGLGDWLIVCIQSLS